MMETAFNPVFLSRLQFAATTMFHILFPTLTIGLGIFLVVVELLWVLNKLEIYYRIYRFWVKIFAINFGVGVVSGIVLEFEFGTNFSRFSQAVGNIFSPPLAFESMTAFFMEAGFLGIMLFGWKRVSKGIHFLSTCLVAAGGLLSAFWIIAANSWMQTPAGYQLVDGKFLVTDFFPAILNPSALIRVSHMGAAALESSVFAIAGISAYFLRQRREVPFFQRSLGLALILGVFVTPLQIFLGDTSGIEVFHHQPAKLAAMEAHWKTNIQGGAPFTVFAFPDKQKERNLYQIAIPNGLSLLVTRTLDGKVLGLKEIPRENRPNVFVLFWAFRFMVAIGFIFLLVMIWAVILWRRKKLYENRMFLWTLMAIQPFGFLATELGWVTSEMGRQPWLVYNIMRISEGISPIPAGNVIWSLSLLLIIFLVIGGSYFFFVFKTLRSGPDLTTPIPLIQRPAGMRARQEESKEG